MDRRVTALATLVLGAALALPGAHGVAAQDDQNPTGPTQLGGLGTITTDIIAGIASDVAAGTDGNVAGASLGNSGTAGLDGTEASVAGPAGSLPVPEPDPDPEPAAEPEPEPEPAAEPVPAAEPAPEESDGEPVAPAAAAPAEGSAPPAADACGYPTWYDAQLALETDASLASTLDPDNDGIACEEAMY